MALCRFSCISFLLRHQCRYKFQDYVRCYRHNLTPICVVKTSIIQHVPHLQPTSCSSGNRSKDALYLQGIDPDTMDLHRISNDCFGPLTTNGGNILQLRKFCDRLLMNGLPCYPASRSFTCFPHNNGANVVDYVMANQELLPLIQHFSVYPLVLANYALLIFSFSISPTNPSRPTRGTFYSLGNPMSCCP